MKGGKRHFPPQIHDEEHHYLQVLPKLYILYTENTEVPFYYGKHFTLIFGSFFTSMRLMTDDLPDSWWLFGQFDHQEISPVASAGKLWGLGCHLKLISLNGRK